MVVNLKWGVLVDRMYVKAPTGKSKEDLDALLFDRVARRNRTDPYDERSIVGKEVQTWWKTCKDWMARYKTHSEPFIYDIKNYLTRKQLHSQKWMHSWRIAQRGGRLGRVRTNSSVDVCQTFVTYLSTQEQILTWRTSKHGQHGELLHGGREHLRG